MTYAIRDHAISTNGAKPKATWKPDPSQPNHPLHRLTPEQIEEIGRECQAIHDKVYSELGADDANYIRAMVQAQRRLVVASRAVLIASRFWPAWILGTAGLSVAKILENMEIGHNVMHGQWDWMNDPYIHSSSWDWDNTSPAASWKHSHNYLHHTFTNIVGKDIDVGYEIMRMDPKQPWHPRFLGQPVYNLLLALFFEWGVALHDIDVEAIFHGTKDKQQLKDELKEIGVKVRRQVVKDYVAWPAISAAAMLAVEVGVIALFDRKAEGGVNRFRNAGRRAGGGLRRGGIIRRLIDRRAIREPFLATLSANITANLVRNLWAYAIIFCGHFPDQTYTFTEEEVANETQGGWYVRQLLGSANIEGSRLFHIMSGNLSFQVEHHIFPDMPSSRYQEIAPQVRAICEKYDLPYNIGPFHKQLFTVQRTILRLMFPGGSPRPKQGPHREPAPATTGNGQLPVFP
ncbi:acyl-CoA desaturase [Hoyosella rhizosphaerae]|uniref:Fatty acid desaturase n=1 Tax=Hoyosella rhizosphaerae TaxID=1755582 RepID=A0A916UC74_9ACTN|nr:acyl-CoA desaturase [Hoyosella rhizosphaerae]MBN4925880.1 acyl-CoA desaturase [Hoyosella rhizosphaerae]GGC67220.1 fatty acid desaturase [Hoyosella rhizosphaerae]